MKILIIFVFCIFLLVLSAFFSGSETALFSLSEPEIEGIIASGKRRRLFFHDFLRAPYKLLTTILLSNTVCNVAFSFLITLIFLEFIAESHIDAKLWMVFDTIFVTLLLLTFGEFTPKFYAMRRKIKLSKMSIIPLFYLTVLLHPFVFFLNLFNRWIMVVMKKRIKEEISYSEIKTLFEVSEKEGVFRGKEKEIINSLFTLNESVVSEIMVPRTKAFFINCDMKIEEVYSILLKKPYSRIPVYSTSEEKIDGILYLKDILIHRQEKERRIKTILREALFIPEKMRLKDLFLEFRRKRIHFAIVVNEFGGVEGIVTMNDILEEIVGSIKDEYHRNTIQLYRYIAKNEILVNGELKIDDFPKRFYKMIPRGDYETISGFVLSILGRVPEKDESFIYKNLVFTIVELDGRRLEKIIIKKEHGKEEKKDVS